MRDVHPYLETLAAQVHGAGGWGYTAGQEAHLEPTCLALLALSLDAGRFQVSIDRAKQALSQCAQPDGSYRLARAREEAIWPTALVLFVQAALDYPRDEIERTASRLLALRGRIPDDPKTAELIDIDFKLVGWPWAENNFSWAEPTAWACLALRRAGYGSHARVADGLRLLLDRASDDGGINYGNRRVFARLTQPIPGPTALMLLALQGYQQPRIGTALAYLRGHALNTDDLEHLCWAKLALDIYRDRPGSDAAGRRCGDMETEGAENVSTSPRSRVSASDLQALDQRILGACQARAATAWLRPSPLRTALTALALASDQHNYFRLLHVDQEQSGVSPDGERAPLADTGKGLSPCLRVAESPHRSFGQRLKAVFRGLALEAVGRLRPLPARTAVHIARANDYDDDLADLLQRQYAAFRDRVPLAGKRLVLKPNLVEYHRDKVINTHPHLVAAAIELCKREGAAEVVVAEGPGHWRNAEYLVAASGLGDVLRHYGVPFVDLNHDEPFKTPNLGRLTGLDYLYLSRTVAAADVLISLAKLKTHHWAGATLSLKNLFGILPGTCYGWPKNELHWRGIDNSIVDIALTRTPDLAIVDGIIGMEGDGPLNGTPKPLSAVIMGIDPLAVDATCCRLMQLDPERIGYLVLGHRKRLGLLREEQIQQLGERIDALAQPFQTLPHFQQLYLGRSA